METNVKRDLASTASDQPTQPKKTCFPSVKSCKKNLILERCLTEEDVRRVEHGNMKKASDNCNDVEGFHGRGQMSKEQTQSSKSETSNGLESDPLPKSSLTEEDRGREVGELRELVKSQLSDVVGVAMSPILNALKRELVPDICSSLEDTIRRVMREEWKHAPCLSAQLVRSPGTCREKNEERNFKLQFMTKPPALLYTWEKLKGECGDSFVVKLFDANTGTFVESGRESSVKLKVVVLEGGFEKEDDDNWTQEEFKNSVANERKGKGVLLRGKLEVTLNRGTGVLGDVQFTANSTTNNSSGQFRIGLQAPPGYCENIREAITEAFTVHENRGKSNNKHSPPSPNDDVWKLRNIGRDGPFCNKLNEAGIYKVKDFLQQHDMDSEKLRQILGKGITDNKWEDLLAHANTCPRNGKPYLCHNYGSDHGVILDNVGQRIGLTADGVSSAADKVSLKQKERAREPNDETFAGPMQNKRARSSSSQVWGVQIENAPAVQHPLAPPVNEGSPAEGHTMEIWVDESFGLASYKPILPEDSNVLVSPGDNGIPTVGLPMQSHDTNVQSGSTHPLPGVDPMAGNFRSIFPDSEGDYFLVDNGCSGW